MRRSTMAVIGKVLESRKTAARAELAGALDRLDAQRAALATIEQSIVREAAAAADDVLLGMALAPWRAAIDEQQVRLALARDDAARASEVARDALQDVLRIERGLDTLVHAQRAAAARRAAAGDEPGDAAALKRHGEADLSTLGRTTPPHA